MTTRVAWALLAGLCATAVAAEEKPAAKPAEVAAAEVQTGPAAQAGETPQGALAEAEKLSYALGVDLANHFKRQSIQVEPDAFARGLKDALAGASLLLSEQELQAQVATLRAEMMKKAQAERQAAAERAKVEGAKAKTEGEAFLAANKAKPGVVTLESGLQYEILQEGTGSKPTLENTVTCHYRGTLVDGTEFDSSLGRGEPASFPVKGVIKGWTEALQLMPVGSKWRIVVPSALAYGEGGAGPIPPNSTLVFEVELLAIK